LIVSLMMLVVMTILAISAVTTTTMQEKMAGNIRNIHLSFQSAEAVLRAGETVANTMVQGVAYDGTNGLYSASNYGDANFPIWEWEGAPAINWQDITTAVPLVVTQPQYIVEDYGLVTRDDNCEFDVTALATCFISIYRVTARGWGLNENAKTVLQSTYKQI